MSLQTTPSHPNADSYVTVAEADTYFQNRSDVADWDALSDDQKEAILKLATKHIDTMRFFGEQLRPTPNWHRDKQELKFPRVPKNKTQAGMVDSATVVTFTDSARANQPTEPADYWNNGAVIIIDGTGQGQTRKITDFGDSDGTFVVEEAWDTNPDTTSQYKIVDAIPSEVKDATCEQALYLVNGGGERQKMQSEGVKSYSIGDLSETFADGLTASGKVAISNEALGMLKGLRKIIGKMTA